MTHQQSDEARAFLKESCELLDRINHARAVEKDSSWDELLRSYEEGIEQLQGFKVTPTSEKLLRLRELCNQAEEDYRTRGSPLPELNTGRLIQRGKGITENPDSKVANQRIKGLRME